MLIHLSNAFLRTAAQKLCGHYPEEDRLHLFGIRSATPEGEAAVRLHEPRFNAYDDTVGVFGTALRVFSATVDPGRTWTTHPMNAGGAAHLEPGRYLYRLGLHHGGRALVQAGAVTVRRDRDRDGTAEPGERLDTGWFGIDIHRGGSAPTVEAWSAGCQVLPARQFTEFLALCATAGQTLFEYYLFDGSALGKLVTP